MFKKVILGALLLSLCVPVYADAEAEVSDQNVCTVTADYSASEFADENIDISNLEVYSDEACENMLSVRKVSMDEDNKKITFEIEYDSDIDAIYVVPPVFTVQEDLEKTELPKTDDGNSDFHIADVSVQDAHIPDSDIYEIAVTISSGTGKYPVDLKLDNNGYILSAKTSATFESSVEDGTVSKSITDYSFHFEAGTEEEAGEILENASFHYYHTRQFEAADDWTFSSDDMQIHVLDLTLNAV